jgi:hypothetical protein
MARSKEPQKDVPLFTPTSPTTCYVLRTYLHPNEWKLQLRDSSGQTLFEVLRRPTKPIRYRVQTKQVKESLLTTIKTITIGDIQRYILFEGNQAKLSIRQSASSPLVLLQDPKRKTIARFTSITPELTLLRTQTNVIARLRFKEYPMSVGFIVDCQVQPILNWLYAILLYVTAQIESLSASSLPEEVPRDKPEDDTIEAASH